MARRDADSIISKLRQMSGEGLTSVVNELMSNDKLRKRLGQAGERMMANKHVFDRNVETVLDFMNIPSKRDVRDLKSRLDTLSSQFVNLSMKVDRMLEAGRGGESGGEHPTPGRRTAARRQRRSKSD
jgi:polyhydroxyalkanoate synthesis regulator phasin